MYVSKQETLYFFCRFGVAQVAKAEIERQPIIGPLSAGALNVFVIRRPGDKGGPTAQTIAQVKTTIDARAKNMGAGGYPHLCLYPEGTTTNGTAIISFKLGAFLPGMPVQVACVYIFRRMCFICPYIGTEIFASAFLFIYIKKYICI